jgi:uncharacterized membrane protein YkvA (DUF1232 family)
LKYSGERSSCSRESATASGAGGQALSLPRENDGRNIMKETRQLEDKSIDTARKRFIFSIVLLVLAVIYLISPIDIKPDALVPIGYLEDIPLLITTAIYAGYSYRKLKKERSADPS